MLNEEMRAYSFVQAIDPNLTNSLVGQDPIRGLKVGKALGSGGIPNRVLMFLPLSAVSLLVVLFKAIFATQCFPAARKPTRMFFILKP
jgi:hypothetical protein